MDLFALKYSFGGKRHWASFDIKERDSPWRGVVSGKPYFAPFVSGRPLAREGQLPIVLRRVQHGGGRRQQLTDLLYSHHVEPLVSTRFYQHLKPYLPQHAAYNCELRYKGQVESTDYVAVNIETTLDCLDLKKSSFTFYLEGDRFEFTDERRKVRFYGNPFTKWYIKHKYRDRLTFDNIEFMGVPSLDASRIPPQQHVFRLHHHAVTLVATNVIRDIVDTEGITGVTFEPIKIS